jgi:CDGSH-type Zn-finger protein
MALCRCGASAIKPYCDATHKMIKFRHRNPERFRPGQQILSYAKK